MKITTREQLEAHIKAHKGKDVPLYSSYGDLGFVTNDTIRADREISIRCSQSTGSTFIFIDGVPRYSLKDRHLDGEQTYNNNWWFTKKEAAKEYAGVSD